MFYLYELYKIRQVYASKRKGWLGLAWYTSGRSANSPTGGGSPPTWVDCRPVKSERSSRNHPVLCGCWEMYCGPSSGEWQTVHLVQKWIELQNQPDFVGIVRWMGDDPISGPCLPSTRGQTTHGERTVRRSVQTHRRGRLQLLRSWFWVVFVPMGS